MLPVAAMSKVSPSTIPSTDTSLLTRSVPSYGLDALPVLIVTALGITVSVPSTVTTLVKFFVLSFPSLSLMTYPLSTTFLLSPAFFLTPFAVASTVKPSGSPLAMTLLFSSVPSAVRALPSYTLLAEGAVRVISASFSVTVRVPSSFVTV